MAAPASSRDPFLWDVESTLNHLCASKHPWVRDDQALSNAIREEEIDGKTLLTYEFLVSRQELLQCLGIKPARLKAALGQAILDLRFQSPTFKQWKRDFDAKQEGILSDELDLDVLPSTTPTQPSVSAVQAKSATPAPIALVPKDDDNQATPKPRKRIAPVNLEPQDGQKALEPVPSGADWTTAASAPVPILAGAHHKPWDDASPGAYLGPGGLPESVICSPGPPLSGDLIEADEDDFSVLSANRIPPGRRLATYSILKRFLQKNSRREAGTLEDSHQHNNSDSLSDQILTLDDLPADLDEETRAEIAEENDQLERIARGQMSTFLSQEQVSEALDEAVKAMEQHWQEVRLPRKEKSAYSLWMGAARSGRLKELLLQARQRAEFYEARVQRLREGILDETWSKPEDVVRQAGCLESNIEDKLFNVWLTQLYQSRTAPPKPVRNLQAQPPKQRQQQPQDEDIWTSSDDDDFIEQDDADVSMPDVGDNSLDVPDVVLEPSPAEIPVLDVKSERRTSPVVDLTSLSTPKKSRDLLAVVDLVTPEKASVPLSLPPSSAPQADVSLDSKDCAAVLRDLESHDDIEKISEKPWKFWSHENDRWKLVIWLIRNINPFARRKILFDGLRDNDPLEAFEKTIEAQLHHSAAQSEASESPDRTLALDVTRIFLSCLKIKSVRVSRVAKILKRDQDVLKESRDDFMVFYDFVRAIEGFFPAESQVYRMDTFDVDLDIGDDDGHDGAEMSQQTPSKRRAAQAKEITRNKEAVDLREREQERARLQATRRQQLQHKLKLLGTSSDLNRLIINDTKEDEHAIIHVHEDIGPRIKDHQINGVKFMWDQVLSGSGCLLAHTMGLGKTMQVITLLVAIAQAGKSTQPAVYEQIPERLRRSHTLILCPSGLADNWLDELLIWTPEGMLGRLEKLDASIAERERASIVRNWATIGGVLVVGYPMLKKMVVNEDMEDLLTSAPSIVVADEAHNMKNPKAFVTRVCSQFETKSRIALTGSPLANNVEEYHAMIEWVAPNFLGPLSEFRDIYATPIQQGLYKDSNAYEKRKALKMLQVLKETVAPKVNRATMECLRHDLPAKYEYVISLKPTPKQLELYDLYIHGLSAEGLNIRHAAIEQSRMFTIINHLALICNHPHCLRQKALEIKRTIEMGGASQFPPDIMAPILEKTLVTRRPELSCKVEYLLLILDEARRLTEKVLVFCQSFKTLDYLQSVLEAQHRKIARLDGKTAIGKRQQNVRNFNAGNTEVYLISTKAGGVGLNIQSANRVVIFDSKWNPVDDQQAIGRAWRIGQDKPVHVYRLIVAGTFEDDLHNRAVFKTQLASRVVDKKNPLSWATRSSTLVHPVHEVNRKDLTEFLDKDVILTKLIKQQQQGSETIRSIVMTDTFEEEDPNHVLTVEERKEATDMVELNKLRSTNPEEYRRKVDMLAALEQQARLAIPASLTTGGSHLQTSSHHPPLPPPRSHGTVNGFHGTPQAFTSTSAAHSVPFAPHMSRESHAQPGTPRSLEVTSRPKDATEGHAFTPAMAKPHTPAGNGSTTPRDYRSLDGAADTPIVIDSDPDVPRRVRYPESNEHRSFSRFSTASTHDSIVEPSATPGPPVPGPMVGANTVIGQRAGPVQMPRNPPLPSNVAPVHRQLPPFPTPTLASQNGAGSSLFGQTQTHSKQSFTNELVAQIRKAQQAQQPLTTGPPQIIAERVTSSIQEALEKAAQGILPDSQRWRFLRDLMTAQRFVVALVSGLWSPKFVAIASTQDLRHRLTTIQGCSEEDFRTQVQKGPHRSSNDEHSSKRKRSMSSDINGRWKSSQDVIDLDRRSRQPSQHVQSPRLPDWAKQAVSGGPARQLSSPQMANHQVSNHQSSHHQVSNHQMPTHQASNHQTSHHQVPNYQMSSNQAPNHQMSRHMAPNT